MCLEHSCCILINIGTSWTPLMFVSKRLWNCWILTKPPINPTKSRYRCFRNLFHLYIWRFHGTWTWNMGTYKSKKSLKITRYIFSIKICWKLAISSLCHFWCTHYLCIIPIISILIRWLFAL